MLHTLIHWIRPPIIRDAAGLERLVEREAARLVQKCTLNYCRVKAGPNAKKLFAEEPFRLGLEACRWEAYALILADFLRVAEAALRPHAGAGRDRVAARLADFYAATLAVSSRPADPAAGWTPHVEALRAALARAALAPPLPSYEIGHASGRAIYDALPIHKSLRREDAGVVINQVRFGTVSLQQELDRRLDAAAVCADYLGGAGAGP